MMPDCSYLKQFELINYENGIIINYPDKCCMDRLDKFEPSDALNGMFHELQDWSAKINCNTVAKLNRIISCGYANGIIQVAEALHEKKIAGIADKIAASNKNVRLVLIAGPSSSGKTTFAQRLSIQWWLMVCARCLFPWTIILKTGTIHRENRMVLSILKALTPLIWSFLMTTCAACWQGSALKCLSIISAAA